MTQPWALRLVRTPNDSEPSSINSLQTLPTHSAPLRRSLGDKQYRLAMVHPISIRVIEKLVDRLLERHDPEFQRERRRLK